MVRSRTQEHGYPPVWRCSQENGNVLCKNYFIKEKYINQAFCKAYASLNTEMLEKQARRRDETVATAAQNALEMKKEIQKIYQVEYYQLDALVERMTFQKWDTLIVQWTFGLKSKVKIQYTKNRDIPNHEEQLESFGSRNIFYIEHRQVSKLSPNVFKRPNVYCYDSIVDTSDAKEE